MENTTFNKKEAVDMMKSGKLVTDFFGKEILWYDKREGIFCSKDLSEKNSEDYFDIRKMQEDGWKLYQNNN